MTASPPSPPTTPPVPVAKPRVLIVNRTYPPVRASTGRLARELARAYARDGWDVRVLTTDDHSGTDPDGPVTVRRITWIAESPGVFGVMILLLRMFFAMLFAPRYDVLITMTDPPLVGVVGGFAAFLRRARHMHWVQDLYPDLLPVVGIKTPRFLYNVFYKASRRMMNKADRVVVIGRCMARYLTQNGVDQGRLTLIPNWPELTMNPHLQMNTPSMSPMDDDVLEAVSQASIMGPIPKFRIMYVGSVGKAHPVDTILDAATILDSMHPEIEFIFVGPEDTHRIINMEKARRGLGNVRVLPHQPQSRLREIMESGDVHIISMKDDAGGLMVPAKFYAMLAAARPVILVGSGATEIGRTLQDYGAGATIPERAAQMLAQTIIDFRLREDLWFAASDGALKAAAAYTAEDMLRLWVRKGRDLV